MCQMSASEREPDAIALADAATATGSTDDAVALGAAVASFKELIGAAHAIDVVRQKITHGPSVIITEHAYSQLRTRIGGVLRVAPNRDVFMVGSAKLGFSIKAKARYRAFHNESDVDIAVVSPELYCAIWDEVRRFNRQAGHWDMDDRKHFKNDHVNGVIKPYLLPDSSLTSSKSRLLSLGAELQRNRYSDYKVTIAIWHSIDALEEYQSIAVAECQEELQS